MKPKSTRIYENNSVKISVHEGWCKACGICIEFCPKNVLVSNHNGKPVPKKIDACIKCNLCEQCVEISKNGEVAVSPVEDSFVIDVESASGLTSEQVVLISATTLGDKMKDFKKALKKVK